MTNCIYSIRIPRELTFAGHSNIVDCGRATVPCPRCGHDSELCAQHAGDECHLCARCEYILTFQQMTLTEAQ